MLTNPKTRAYLAAGIGVLVLLMLMDVKATLGAQDRPAPVPSLAPPSNPRVLAAQQVADESHWATLAQSFRMDMTCNEVAEFAQLQLRHLPTPPTRAGSPTCFIDGLYPQRLPNTAGMEPWFTHVMYIPEDMSPLTASYRDVLDAGGVDIILSFKHPRDMPTVPSNPRASGGGFVSTRIRGATAVVQRVKANLTTARWFESSRYGGQAPRSIGIEVLGDYTGQELADLAAVLSTGSPPSERAPLSSLPPPEVPGSGRPELATPAPSPQPPVPGEPTAAP